MFALQPWRNRWDTDREPHARLDASAFAAVAMVWRVPALRWMSIGGFTYAFTQLSLSTFAVTILVVEAQFSLVAAGAVLAAIQAAGIIGRVVWGIVADRWGIGDALLIVIGVMNLASAFAMVWIGPGWPVWTIYFFFVAFAASCTLFPSGQASVASLASDGPLLGGASESGVAARFRGFLQCCFCGTFWSLGDVVRLYCIWGDTLIVVEVVVLCHTCARRGCLQKKIYLYMCVYVIP